MALVEITLITDEISGGVAFGDAGARTHPTLDWTWAENDDVVDVGTDNKSTNPETVLFLRYKMPTTVPATATYRRGKITFWIHAVVLDGPTGKLRIGSLQQDGKWDHVSAIGFVHGAAAHEYDPSTELPFPTDPGTDAINLGALIGNAFLGTVEYDGSHVLTTAGQVAAGDAAYLPTWTVPGVAAVVGGAAALGWDHVAFVFDAFEVPAAFPEFARIRTDDNLFLGLPLGSWGPHLVLEFETVAPTITSGTPATAAVRNEVWEEHTVTATDDPLSLPLTFTLDSAPRGMTIHATTGLLTWVGTAKQPPADYIVNVRVANSWGDVDTQQLTVHLVDSGVPAQPSETTIANAALVLLGERRISSLDESGKAAKLLSERFEDVRDDLLRTLPWIFATRRASLAEDTEVPGSEVYAAQFTLPIDLLRLLSVDDEFRYGHTVEGRKVLTNIRAPLDITYIARITNPREMDVLFRQSFAAALAVEVAEALTGESGKLELVFSIFRDRIRGAWTANGQESPPPMLDVGEWERSRGREDRD